MNKKSIIRTIYLYLFAGIGLILLIIGVVRFIDMGLKATVFTQADSVARLQQDQLNIPRVPTINIERYEDSQEVTEEELESLRSIIEDYESQKKEWESIDRYTARRQEEASINLALILVGLPLYLYHWKIIKETTA